MSERAYGEAIRFLVVGSAGFIADAGVMWVLVQMTGISPLICRAVSFPMAFALTWVLNRKWTFTHGRARTVGRQFPLYLAVQLTGLAINYGLFAMLFMSGSFWRSYPVLALAAGSATALGVTFALSKFVAFAEPRQRRD